jgi:MarR family transcriptional regulator, transcriptional regulator for hemolysin
VRVVITEAGHALLPAIERAWVELAEETMGEAGEDELEIVLSTLETANDRLRLIVGEGPLAEE